MLLIPTISLFLLFVDQIASEKLSISSADETGSIWPYLIHHKKPLSSQQPPLNFPHRQPELHLNHHHNRNNHHEHQLTEHTKTNEITFFNEEAGKSLDQYFNSNNNNDDDDDDEQQTNHRMNDDSLFSGHLKPFLLSSENNNNKNKNHEQATIATKPSSISRFESSSFEHEDLDADDPADLDVDQSSLHKLPPFLQDVITNHLRQTKDFLSYQQLLTPRQISIQQNNDEQTKITKTNEPPKHANLGTDYEPRYRMNNDINNNSNNPNSIISTSRSGSGSGSSSSVSDANSRLISENEISLSPIGQNLDNLVPSANPHKHSRHFPHHHHHLHHHQHKVMTTSPPTTTTSTNQQPILENEEEEEINFTPMQYTDEESDQQHMTTIPPQQTPIQNSNDEIHRFDQPNIVDDGRQEQQVASRGFNTDSYVHYQEINNGDEDVQIVTLKPDESSINHETLTTTSTSTPSTLRANESISSSDVERKERATTLSTYIANNDGDVHYSKIIQSSPNNLLINNHHQQYPMHHLGHLSRIRTGHQEPLSRYANNGLNSFIVAVLIGLGVTGTLLAIVNHKMRTFKSRLYSKQQRRSLVPNIVDCN